ncbi:MAG: TetR/AcrR family transcriptional regulator [Paenibacillaceae bacterium]|jgi:AcrR family transcriptional regulator|nr:TetR/AcrR family transcriptional regulator [Paenibacillaceae bacterium]
MGQGADTKERIMQAALEEFSLHGFEGARMEKIASKVGINKASLYFYFKSKEQLFRELFDIIVKKHYAYLTSIFCKYQDLPSRQLLSSLYKDYLEYHWGNTEMDFWNMVYYYPPEPMKEEIMHFTQDSYDVFTAELTSVMEKGIKNGELQPLNPADMAATFYYLVTCITLSTGLMNLEQGLSQMDLCFHVFWNGIKG